MLNGEEKYVMQHKFVAKAEEIRKLAKSGRHTSSDLCEAMKMHIHLHVKEEREIKEIESLRIFENIFE